MRNHTFAALISVAALGAGFLAAAPAHATEYDSSLKIRGVQYNAPGTDNNSCTTGNTHKEYLTIRNYSRTGTVNLKGYKVKDAAGNGYTFSLNHYLQPGDYVMLRGGKGTESDGGNVAYRNSCNFIWNNDADTIYVIKPSGRGADTHSYRASVNDRDGNGYITYHGG